MTEPEPNAQDAPHSELQSELATLGKLTAPQGFGARVEETIRRRSGGRFFGRKAFGDRVPFELLAVIALAIALAIYLVLRTSVFGTLRHLDSGDPKPQIRDETREAVPRP